MFNNTGTQLTMPVQPAYGGGFGNGFGTDGYGIIWLFALFALFGWGGNGFGGFGGGNGAMQNYVLGSDFAMLQSMIQEGNSRTESKLDSVNNGICSLGYDQLGQMHSIQDALTSQHFDIMSKLSDCCCQNREAIAGVNYNLATDTCAINTNIANATRDILENNNANTRAILDTMNAQAMAQKDERICELNAELQSIKNGAYIVNQLRTPTPIPAYVVQNPNCNCNGGYPFGYFNGTTVA